MDFKKRNLLEDVQQILSKDIENIVKTQDSLLLINCYSKLYLCGGNPGWCERSQRKYYSELQKTGIIKAMEYNEIQNKTNVPNWQGIKFICKNGKAFHVNSEWMPDLKAFDLLVNGFLSESDFKILPQKYIDEICKKDVQLSDIDKAMNEISENISKKRGKKKSE